MRKSPGLGTMAWEVFFERSRSYYGLFDDDEVLRGISWYKEDMITLRKKYHWGNSCKIKKIKLSWKHVPVSVRGKKRGSYGDHS